MHANTTKPSECASIPRACIKATTPVPEWHRLKSGQLSMARDSNPSSLIRPNTTLKCPKRRARFTRKCAQNTNKCSSLTSDALPPRQNAGRRKPWSSKPHACDLSDGCSDKTRTSRAQSNVYRSNLHDISVAPPPRLHPAHIGPPHFLDAKATQLSGRASNPLAFRQPIQCPRNTG